MADSNPQKVHGRPPRSGRHGHQGRHPRRPPARSRAMPPGQPGHVAYGEPLTHHAPSRPQPRRALVVRPWYRKKRWVLPLAALVALVVIIGIGGAGQDTPDPLAAVPVASTAAGGTASVQPAALPATVATPKRTPTKKAAVEQAGVGDWVEAGDWQLKVTDVDCGENEVGDGDRSTEAEGQLCLVEIKAKNNSDTEAVVDGDDQKLSDDDGTTYRSDLDAALADDPDSDLFDDGVDPGDTAKGTLVFDVPKKVTITEVTLTGGGTSTGKATVSLR